MKSTLPLGLLGALLAGGCARGPEIKQARLAEKQGQWHVAYEHYCLAGKRRPGRGAIADKLREAAPGAAKYWQARAEDAMADGDYPRAWQLYMKALTIRPDHPTLPETIRRLERHHPTTLTNVRAAYLLGKPLVPAPAPKDAPPPRDRVAAKATTRPESGTPTAAPATMVRRTPLRPSATTRDFLLVLTLSRKDARYPRRAALVDGLSVKLDDTDDDPDPDADLRIYLNGARIRKCKDWRIDEPHPIGGRSGMQYELVVLGIRHETATIQLGITVPRRD